MVIISLRTIKGLLTNLRRTSLRLYLFAYFCLPQTVAEFDLGTVSYEVKTPKCHELRLAVPPHDSITFNFRCEQEAWEWATVLTSSLREAQKGQLVLSTKVPELFRQSSNQRWYFTQSTKCYCFGKQTKELFIILLKGYYSTTRTSVVISGLLFLGRTLYSIKQYMLICNSSSKCVFSSKLCRLV